MHLGIYQKDILHFSTSIRLIRPTNRIINNLQKRTNLYRYQLYNTEISTCSGYNFLLSRLYWSTEHNRLEYKYSASKINEHISLKIYGPIFLLSPENWIYCWLYSKTHQLQVNIL